VAYIASEFARMPEFFLSRGELYTKLVTSIFEALRQLRGWQ
jgi:hypothetical protein